MRIGGSDFFIVSGKHRHRFCASQLQQDVVFGIKMQRCDGPRAGDEDKGFLLQHRSGFGDDRRIELCQCCFEQFSIQRVLLDKFQDHPGTIFLDPPDGIGNRQTIAGHCIEIDPQRQITAIILDVFRVHPSGKRNEGVECKQRMIGQLMADISGLPGINRFEVANVGKGSHRRPFNHAAVRSSKRALRNTALRRAPASGTVMRTISRRSTHRLLIIG